MTERKTGTLVIGGGLIGAFTAYFLSRQEHSVIVLEKGYVGAQSSGANFGNLRLHPLSLRAQAIWEEVESLTSESCEYDKTGHLYIAQQESEVAKLEQYAEISRSFGLSIESGNRRTLVPPQKTLAGLDSLGSVVPLLRNAHVIRVWSGVEGYLPDMLPIIGPSGMQNGLFHGFGCCGHGFQIAPGIGAVLCDLMSKGETATPIEAFDITRFKTDVATDEKIAREFDLTARPSYGQDSKCVTIE